MLITHFPAILVSALLVVAAMSQSAYALTLESNITLTTGLRTDNLDWTIDGFVPVDYPDVKTKAKWKNINSLQFQLGTEILLNRTIYFKGYADFATIYYGNSKGGEEYFGYPIYETRTDAGKGDLTDAGVSIGMFLPITDTDSSGTLSMIPQLGYSSSVQNLWMKSGIALTAFTYIETKLNNNLQTQWYGPWIGFDLRFQASPYSAMVLRYERHKVDYYAKVDWNDYSGLAHPKTIEQDAKGNGDVFALGWRSESEGNWLFGLDVGLQQWTTDRGDFYTYFDDGSTHKGTLDKVNWSSTWVMFIFGKFFPAF